MWFFVVGCRIDQAGIARPVQPNKQPYYLLLLDLIQRNEVAICPWSIFFIRFTF